MYPIGGRQLEEGIMVIFLVDFSVHNLQGLILSCEKIRSEVEHGLEEHHHDHHSGDGL